MLLSRHDHDHSNCSTREALCSDGGCVNQMPCYACHACHAQFDAIAAANDTVYRSLRLGGDLRSSALVNQDDHYSNHHRLGQLNSRRRFDNGDNFSQSDDGIPCNMSSTTTVSDTKPAKGSVAYLLQVLQPRAIKVNTRPDHQTVFGKIALPPVLQLKSQLGDAFVDFDVDMLVKSCHYAIQAKYHEAAWTAACYHPYFLKTNNPAVNPEGVLRDVQVTYTFGAPTITSNDVCLPPPVTFDCRDSLMELCDIIWVPGRQICCVPDHVYCIGERVTAAHKSAQETSTIPFADFKIFGMTNCGQQVKFFQMGIRTAERSQSLDDGHRYIRYDLVEIADLDLTCKDDCEALKDWMNYIHHWGLTVHMPIMKAKAQEILTTQPNTSESWEGKLLRTAFYHDEETDKANTLKFRFLEDGFDPLYFDARSTRKGKGSAHVSTSFPNTIPSTSSCTKVSQRVTKPTRTQVNPTQSTLLPNNSLPPSTKYTSTSQPEAISKSREKPKSAAKRTRGSALPRQILAERSLNTIHSSTPSPIMDAGKAYAEVERPESGAIQQSTTSTPRISKSTSTSKLPTSGTKSKLPKPIPSSRVLRSSHR
ncbi:hypothetical protein BKA61DRAFT_580466 [Leptodontidium sp. MPI-SDFR-AT-0119]|nr:hypothetical protein BKA61DRAFT_580466 [Leptodontidium sp. MPI-SDFR-AT-0119]